MNNITRDHTPFAQLRVRMCMCARDHQRSILHVFDIAVARRE